MDRNKHNEKEKPKDRPHYVNNREFSEAVEQYVIEKNIALANGITPPKVTDYIAQCFLNIANGLANKSNFSRYTFKEEMVMDAVENCLRAINNYSIGTETRTGNPNGFSYFTQISWYAFLRRIAKEKNQVELKNRFLASSAVSDFLINNTDTNSIEHREAYQYFVDALREKIDHVKEVDEAFKQFKSSGEEVLLDNRIDWSEPLLKRRKHRHVDSDLCDFIFESEE